MHYDLPDYGFNNAPFQTIDHDGLSQWQTWRELANQACEAFLGYVMPVYVLTNPTYAFRMACSPKLCNIYKERTVYT